MCSSLVEKFKNLGLKVKEHNSYISIETTSETDIIYFNCDNLFFYTGEKELTSYNITGDIVKFCYENDLMVEFSDNKFILKYNVPFYNDDDLSIIKYFFIFEKLIENIDIILTKKFLL
jgi:hypothetical protein